MKTRNGCVLSKNAVMFQICDRVLLQRFILRWLQRVGFGSGCAERGCFQRRVTHFRCGAFIVGGGGDNCEWVVSFVVSCAPYDKELRDWRWSENSDIFIWFGFNWNCGSVHYPWFFIQFFFLLIQFWFRIWFFFALHIWFSFCIWYNQN